MTAILDEYATDLLRHLGVELVHNMHHCPDGSHTEWIDIYSQPKHLKHVRGWVARQHEDLVIRCFEGPRPPF